MIYQIKELYSKADEGCQYSEYDLKDINENKKHKHKTKKDYVF